MNFYIMTLFPEMVMDGLNTSIIGRAVNKGLLSIEALNIRDYAFNKHHSVDDYPYGGGAGMLMQAEPAGHGVRKETHKSHLSVPAGEDIQPVYGRRIRTGRRSCILMRTL